MKLIRCLFICLFVFQSNAQISDFKTIDFSKADAIALQYKNETLNNLPELSHKLTSNLTTDVERFRAIFTWVCNNVANDYKLYSKNMRKRQRLKKDSLKLKEWNSRFKKETLKKLLKKNKTICTGYAYLVQKLANLANIDCKMINGFARTSTINTERLDTPNHSWNAVKLNKKWYLCDPTWASGIPNSETNLFEFKYNDGFFLATPELFAVDHYPEDRKWLLLEDDSHSFETFIEGPILYGNAYANLSNHYAPKKMHNTIKKNEKVTFKFQLQKAIDIKDVHLLIDSGSNNRKIHPESTSIKNETLLMEYQFKNIGFYDVHFFIGDDVISTYTFKVKKNI